MTASAEKNTTDPMNPLTMASLKHWGAPLASEDVKQMARNVSVDCGWGPLIFGQTLDDPEALATTLRKEKDGRRDVALYMRDPNVVLSYGPQDLFLDPSLTFRLDFRQAKSRKPTPSGFVVRPLKTEDRVDAINRIYLAHSMVPAYPQFYAKAVDAEEIVVLVAEDKETGDIIGTVTGVDHRLAINDPDNGCSLWALAVDPQCHRPAVGEFLVYGLIDFFAARERRFLDLSVMHDNQQAIALYQKLGFKQVPVYCIKNKNPINEQLFIGPDPEEELNVYARIIVKEARRRGIVVEVLDAEGGFFRLTLGGRSIVCRESLSEMTTAVAMSRCDDKAATRRVLLKEGLRVPEQIVADTPPVIRTFLDRHDRVVVKPARGEQGRGIQVDLSSAEEVIKAVEQAKDVCDRVLLEQFVKGEDLRVIVIDNEVVAAAVRRPAQIRGNGKMTVGALIEHQSRRRAAATDGESEIPLDKETRRCVAVAGYGMNDVLPDGVRLQVRKTANLHTGGTIYDVTDRLHPILERAAVKAAKALEIPLVGLDFIVPDIGGPDYVIIEANERPGLANHEPQPTAEKFIDLLFPNTKK